MNGELEIWEQHFEEDLWRFIFFDKGELLTLSGFIPGPIEFWGREKIEPWFDV